MHPVVPFDEHVRAMLETVESTLRLAVDAEPEGVRYDDLAGLLGLHDPPDIAVRDLAEMGLITRVLLLTKR